MKRCTGMWIVAPITRAVDDKAAKSLLGDAFKRQLKMDGGFESVTFICSKTDDISILECQESLGLEAQTSALWTKSKEYNSLIQRNKQRLMELKDTTKEHDKLVDDIDDQIENWESLKDEIENGNSVFASHDKSWGAKRRRSSSNAPGTPKKKRHRASESDSEDSYAETESEDELNGDETELQNQGHPLTLEEVMEKLSTLKLMRKERRRQRQEIDAQMKIIRKETSEIKIFHSKAQAEISAISISGRNEYSRSAIQKDFAAGIKELDQELGEEIDSLNFDPGVDVRDYDEVARSLPVFCVSSRAYQKLQGRFQKESNVPGFQTIEETEIPQLQAHCKKLTEAIREANCRRFLNSLDQLLNSLRLISSPEGMNVTKEQKAFRTATVESEFELFGNGLEEHIKSLHQQIAQEIDAEIIGVCNKAIVTAKKQAIKTVTRWGSPRTEGGFLWKSYKALCRRNGAFSNYSGNHDWNAELIEPIMKAVAPGWEKVFYQRFQPILNISGKKSAELVKLFHDGVNAKVGSDTGSLGSLHMLSRQMSNYQQILNDIFKQHFFESKRKSKDINRMFQPVISETLDSVYRACVEESGMGSFKRMKDAMYTFVDDARDTMFHESVDTVKTALEELCQSLVEDLRNKTKKILESVKRDYMSALVRGVLPKDKHLALGEVLKIITESESIFTQLIITEIQTELDSGSADNDELQAECLDDRVFTQENDDTGPFSTHEMDFLIKKDPEEEDGDCPPENQNVPMKGIQVKSEDEDDTFS